MLPILIAGGLLLGPRLDFYADKPYDPSVPKPESILHYGPGEKVTVFRDQERTIMQIAQAAKERVRIEEYGQSVEGRPLRVAIIGSAQNIARLPEIRREHEQLARGLGDPSKTPVIVWINECIHGDEPASFEAGMWTLYNLAASRSARIKNILDNEIVILNPVYNPDGHERFAVYYDSVATGSSDRYAFEGIEPGAIYGRLNHFRFDMNRDRVAFSQPETKQEFAEYLRWNPQVYADQHGQVGSYFFPPTPMSVNTNVDRDRVNRWYDVFGTATGKAFDAHGFEYYVRDAFDLYYPGYLDSSTTLSGSIGMTHETDGGARIASERRDGSVVTLRSGIQKHFLSALAVAETAAQNRQALLESYRDFKRRCSEGKAVGSFQRVVMQSPDTRPLERIAAQLKSAGIESYYAGPIAQTDTHDYWSAAKTPIPSPGYRLVVDLAQPQAALAKALLEPSSDFEPQFTKEQVAKLSAVPDGERYPGPEGGEFYDATGWALPYAHRLKAWWCESAPALQRVAAGNEPRPIPPKSTIGYALPYSDQEDALAAFDALDAGVRVTLSTRPMSLGGARYERGTFLFLADRNEDGYRESLLAATKHRNVSLIPLTTSFPDSGTRQGPGSESAILLRKPSVALVMGSSERLFDSGAAWFILEREFHVPFTPILAEALASADLSKYTAIILPAGASVASSTRLREWMNEGGCVVGLGNIGWALGSGEAVDLDRVKDPGRDIPGSLFRAEGDSRSFLTMGYSPVEGTGLDFAVPISGNTHYLARKEGGSIIRFAQDAAATKLLTGWEWPNETEKVLAGTVWLQEAPVGRGHAVLFTHDPTERAMWPGLDKMLINAMLIGPST